MKWYRNTKAWLLRLDRKQRDANFTVHRSYEHHTCPYCHEEFEGNHCPQCGLEPRLHKVTWRSMVGDFFDIWNLGNGRVFRTMRQLLWRPGYMINDWLNGHRQLYFPPVLTLIASCVVFSVCLWIRGQELHFDEPDAIEIHAANDSTFNAEIGDLDSTLQVKLHNAMAQTDSVATDSMAVDNELAELLAMKATGKMNEYVQWYNKWSEENYAYSLILGKIALTLLLPICFRRSPRRRKTTLPEFFFALIYMDAALMIVSSGYVLLTGDFQPAGGRLYMMPNWLSIPLLILTLRQLFGYSLWGCTWRFFVTLLLLWITLGLIIVLFFAGYMFGTGVAVGLQAG